MERIVWIMVTIFLLVGVIVENNAIKTWQELFELESKNTDDCIAAFKKVVK